MKVILRPEYNHLLKFVDPTCCWCIQFAFINYFLSQAAIDVIVNSRRVRVVANLSVAIEVR
jgi:hypothetical protein